MTSTLGAQHVLASALDQSLPTILNSDGDEVVFCSVRFPLRSNDAASEIRERLRTVAGSVANFLFQSFS